MNLQEAYDMIDLLLDKADQPYFTDDEKNMFIDQAISAFIKRHYQFYEQEQVSRDALQFFHYESFKASNQTQVSATDATTGEAIIYDFENWSANKKLHKDYMHLINFEVLYDDTGFNTTGYSNCKILGSKNFLDLKTSSDPFNKPSKEDPICYVGHGGGDINNPQGIFMYEHARVFFLPATSVGACKAQQLILRNHTECFSNVENNRVKELYQREIIDITVRKMVVNIESMNVQSQSIETEQSKSI